MYTLNREQLIRRPLNEVFAFFARPENLARITPSSLAFDILTPLPIKMKEGAVIDYTVKPLFFKVHWRTLITDYQPPYKFVDVQIKGPYVFWHHTHTFEEVPEGTLIRDEVHYVLPFGWLGRLVHPLFIKKQLRQIFDYRSGVIEKTFHLPEYSEESPKS
jgi:ligand-binding SRPBCC domain-containing protein